MKNLKFSLHSIDVYFRNEILILDGQVRLLFSIYFIIDLTAKFRLHLNQYIRSQKIADHLNGKLKNKLNMTDVFVLRHLFNGKNDKDRRRNHFDMFRVE